MKLSTHLWAKFESKGYPAKTIVVNGTISTILKDFIAWLTEEGLFLNSAIVLTMGKTEESVSIKRRGQSSADEDAMMAELAALIGDDSDEH